MKWELAEKQVWVDSDGMELEVCLVRDDHLCYHEPGLGLVACSSEYILGRAHLIKHQSGADIDEEKYEYRMGSFGHWEGEYWDEDEWVKSEIGQSGCRTHSLYRRLKRTLVASVHTECDLIGVPTSMVVKLPDGTEMGITGTVTYVEYTP